MRTGKTIRRTLVILILVAAGVITAALLAGPLLDIDIDFGLTRDRSYAESVAILRETRDLFALSTVEIVYKSVFPYDFVPSEMNWARFVEQAAEGRALSPREQEYLRIYQLCREIGIDLRQGKNEFVVITGVVQGGFDLSDTVFAQEQPDKEDLQRLIQITSERIVRLRLPEATVTDLVIEDARTEEYAYPDIDVNPEQWRRIAEFMGRMIGERVIREGRLASATENGKAFLRNLILSLGYRDVIFVE